MQLFTNSLAYQKKLPFRGSLKCSLSSLALDAWSSPGEPTITATRCHEMPGVTSKHWQESTEIDRVNGDSATELELWAPKQSQALASQFSVGLCRIQQVSNVRYCQDLSSGFQVSWPRVEHRGAKQWYYMTIWYLLCRLEINKAWIVWASAWSSVSECPACHNIALPAATARWFLRHKAGCGKKSVSRLSCLCWFFTDLHH